jgi:hypothetical protein
MPDAARLFKFGVRWRAPVLAGVLLLESGCLNLETFLCVVF